jgi:hypothetical protein
MTPLMSWGLVALLVSLGVLAAFLVTDWLEAAEDRRWERDADRWRRARERLKR